ncbi:MAG TPA: NF038122 family metalloprotease [Chthoniobacterales bacterium]|nr:NF038122 family metalloprotease [Chthoniobacterales bacterium]
MNNLCHAVANMRRPAGVTCAVAGIMLATFALNAATRAPGPLAPVPSAPAVARHVSHADREAPPNLSQGPATVEIEPPQVSAPTRSSFMTTWQRVPGARGYRLDVATDSSFTQYVEGYRDLDVGNVTGCSVTGLSGGTTYYYRVRAYDSTSTSANSEVMAASTAATAGLVMHAYFDRSITGNPNAAAIEAMINRCVAIFESLFSDRVTINILFRYATTAPDGSRLPSGAIAYSQYVIYPLPWGAYINALRADGKTSNDAKANATLPGSPLSSNIEPASADGRALGFNTPPAMFGNGDVGDGGPYDGIVTLNSAEPYKFSRPPSPGYFDAQRSTEHEMDEVIGLGSRLGGSSNNLRPQDLFSWSSPGVRNVSPRGTRYFSINGGSTNIVNFNQDSDGDFGDWLSATCPQAHPYVQNAFACTGQFSDIAPTSPEGINLDVIGYNLVSAALPQPTDFNGDKHPDYVLYNTSTRQTVFWFLNNNVLLSGYAGPTLPANWRIADVADFNRDGHPDFALFNPSTLQTVIWYFSGAKLLSGAAGPTLPTGWQLVATADFNADGRPDYVLYNPGTRQTVLWLMNNNVHIGSAFAPTLATGWTIAGVADFNRDGKTDYLLFNAGTGQSRIAYLSGATLLAVHDGPAIGSGYQLVGTSDFNGDAKPDYVLFKPSTGQTQIWYLDNYLFMGTATGPTLPAGWILAAP